jgi:hypothetical protein
VKEYDVTVTYTVAAESEDEARNQIQPLLDGHCADIDYVEEIQ